MAAGKHTYSEILSQPEVWAAALKHAGKAHTAWRSLLSNAKRPLIFLGCGSTYYLALSIAALFRRLTAHPAIALPSGEFLYRREDFLGKRAPRSVRPLMIVVSRSGETSESVRAAQQYREEGGHVLAVTTRPASTLTTVAEETLLLPEAQEESVAQTRSFTSMFVGLNALAVLLGGHRTLWQRMQKTLPQAGKQVLERYASLAQQLGEDLALERFYFLGSGWQYGLASEASLKMKEISLSHSEPFHFLEFRHGPMSMVNEHTLIFGLLSDTATAEAEVLQEMQKLGARLLSLGKAPAQVAFDTQLPLEGGGTLYLPVLQLTAYHRALAKGLDPDHPHNLQAVVTLDFSKQAGEKK